MQTQQTFASGTQVTLSARFPAMAARIDNLSNQWYVITGMPGGWCPPYTAGLIIALAGAGSVSMTPQAPTQTIQPAVVAGEQVTVTLLSEAQPGGPGIGLPGSNVPTGIITANFAVTSILPLTLYQPLAALKRVISLAFKAEQSNTIYVQFSSVVGGGQPTFYRLYPGENVSLSYISASSLFLGSGDQVTQASVNVIAVF